MKEVGPLPNCMRYESKHREGKVSSHVAICRKNVCRTIAIRHQLMLNNRFLNEDTSNPPFISGSTKNILIHELDDVQNFLHLIPQSVTNSVASTNWVEYLGHKIKRNSIITIFSENGPQFHLVHTILVNDKELQVVSKRLDDCFFDEHLQAYKVFDDDCFIYCLLKLEDIASNVIVTTINKLANGYNYIPKYWI